MSSTSALRLASRVAVVAGVAALLALGIPKVTGAGWSAAATSLGAIAPRWLLLLALIWVVGLCLNAVTNTAGMPGLGFRRALLLSLTGSAVANVLPFGGAAGIALNRHMTKAWGHGPTEFAAYTAVTNAWDVAFKLLLAAATVPLLGVHPVGTLAGAVGVVGVLLMFVLATPWASRLLARHPRGRVLLDLRARSAEVIVLGWRRLTLSTLSYNAALALLLWTCAHVAGLPLGLSGLAVAFAAERLLTLTGVTPGGAGVVEVGLSAVLVAGGGDPAAVVTTVLLYRLFTYAIEIPVGGAGLVVWLAVRRFATVRRLA